MERKLVGYINTKVLATLMNRGFVDAFLTVCGNKLSDVALWVGGDEAERVPRPSPEVEAVLSPAPVEHRVLPKARTPEGALREAHEYLRLAAQAMDRCESMRKNHG